MNNIESQAEKLNKKRGRPLDEFAYARNRAKELRGDAKRLETIAKKMRQEADDLMNEIRVQKTFKKNDDKGTLTTFHSTYLEASIEIELPRNRQEVVQDAIENLFEDEE